ncbi:MAG: YybH family protein [Gemmatimonadales bacterium]
MRSHRITLALVAAAALPPPSAPAQDRRDEQFYYPGSFNWAFLESYPEAARLFNAFDYGHAVLYQRLYTLPDSARAAAALEREYRFLTTDLLVRPPRFAVAEEVIEPAYAKLAWRAKLMFDWAHVLHRQIYDVYADEGIPEARRDSLIERLTDYYLRRRDIAFPPVAKSMALMDEQYYSQVFRQRFPKFNGLIWAYHWLQVGLYEPFIAGQSAHERKTGIQAAVARFWDMLKDPPATMPRVMPMAATVAPLFTERHPRAAAIFDNLHMMHDIISDILAADTVPRERKRVVIYGVLAEFRDTTRNVMTREEWLMMGHHMGGVEAMGGPVRGLLRGGASQQEATPPPAAPAGHERGHGARPPGAQDPEANAVRRVVEAVAASSQARDLAGLDTLYAPDSWVRVIEGAGVNNGWAGYRDNHLKPELAEFRNFRYRYYEIEPQVRGNVAWAPFRYELSVDAPSGHVEVEGRGTAILERRGGRWLVVHLHTSGPLETPGD